jgi:uncharacterized protein (TIGR02453 family)
LTNKQRYEKQVREPLLQFIADFGLRLAEISPHYVADARRVGGSLFRINRDIRFSKEKTPYKTHAGVQFRHEVGKDAHAPGFYLHLEPDSVFVGVGMWQPIACSEQVRQAIVEQPDAGSGLLPTRFRPLLYWVGSRRSPKAAIQPFLY